MKKGILSVMISALAATTVCAATDGTWDWSATVTPSGVDVRVQQWAWENSANWKDATLPSGDTAVAYLVPADQSSSIASEGARWIRVPDAGVDLGEVNIRQYATIYLTGGPIRFGSRSTLSNFPRIRDEGTTCTMWIYCPIDFTKKETTLNRAYFCGPFAYSPSGKLASSNYVRWYANAWATNTSNIVTNPFPTGTMSPGSGSCYYLARMGAAAQTGTWRTYSGSPVLTRVGAKHDLAAGATVTGDNIPAGAFVKCIYNDAAIEISEACTGDSPSEGETVEFGAFENVKTVQHFKLLNNQSSDTTSLLWHHFAKYRAEDVFDVYVDDIFRVQLDVVGNNQRSFAASQGSYFPARIFLKGAATLNKASSYFQLKKVHLVFDPPDGESFSLSGIDFADGSSTAFQDYGPRIETPEGVTATVGKVRHWTLVVNKCGAGTLDMTSTNTTHKALVCEDGTTILRMTAEAATPTISSLVVSNGATFKLAEGTLKVTAGTIKAGATIAAAEGATIDLTTATVEAGATLEGPGEFLLVRPSQISGTKTAGCPKFVFSSQGTVRDIVPYEDAEPMVVGHPAFWVTVEKNVDLMTFEWNGTTYNNGVACWRDCRDGETTYYATNDFSQLETTTGVPSRLLSNKYGKPCIEHKGLATATQSNYRYIQSGMVWNRPITNVCAVFNVIMYDGAGANAILGCTKRFAEMGSARTSNDFRRGVSSTTDGGGIGTWSAYILSPSAAQCVQNGWIYADGKEKAPQGNLSEFSNEPIIWEMHPLPPYGRSDAFAIQEHGSVICSGNQYQMECIIYTNELTQTERRQVCAYLMNKWKGVSLRGVDLRFTGTSSLDGVATDGGVAVQVEDGQVMGLTAITNGTLVKDGAGVLYADFIDGAGIDVRQGELQVRSYVNDESAVQPGQFIHLDASKTNTMEFKSYTFRGQTVSKMVEKWSDPSGTIYAHRRRTDGRYRPGYLAYPEALGGKPVVDFSTLTNIIAGSATESTDYSAGCFYDFYVGEGNRDYQKLSSIGSLFVMLGSRNGGGVLLGDYDLATWRSATADPSKPFFNSNAPAGLRNGEGLLNGKNVSFTSTGLSGGYDTVAVRNLSGTGGNGVQSVMMAYQRRYVGGGEIGELLIYETPLPYFEHRRIDAWLGWKWLGRKTPGFSPSRAASVSVMDGATLSVYGDAPLMAAAVSGAGTIVGDLSCATGCVVEAYVEEGAIAALTVTGALDVSAGGTIRVLGDVRTLRAGTYPLIVAASATGGGAWTVEYSGKPSLKPRVRLHGGALCLDMLSKGIRITVK